MEKNSFPISRPKILSELGLQHDIEFLRLLAKFLVIEQTPVAFSVKAINADLIYHPFAAALL